MYSYENEYDDDIDDLETRYEREPLLGSADGAGQGKMSVL